MVSDATREAVEGVTKTVIGEVRVTLALADFVESAALMAVTVTVCALEIEPGAV